MVALKDLGLSTRARLGLQVAKEFEKQKLRNEEKIDKESVKEKLSWLQDYRRDCEHRQVRWFIMNAFNIKANKKEFHANATVLQLGGMWHEIIEMLRDLELPNGFEGKKVWRDLGTKHRRLVEPLAIATYYACGLNDNSGPLYDKRQVRVYTKMA